MTGENERRVYRLSDDPDTWTVYVEADIEASEDEVARVGELLAKQVPGAVMAPAPVLGCRFTLDDEPLPTRALGAAQGCFDTAVRQALRTRLAAEDREVRVVRAELALGGAPGWVPRGLATAKGLAQMIDRTPTWVRTLMRYKNAPAPVKVEGGTEAVYDTALALAFLRKVTGD